MIAHAAPARSRADRAEELDPGGVPPQVIELAETPRPIFARKDVSDLSAQFDVGAAIQEARSAAPDSFGRKTLEAVAELVGRCVKTLDNCARVAAQWPRVEFQELTARRMPNGKALSWSHFRAVDRIELSPEDRRKWIDRALFATPAAG